MGKNVVLTPAEQRILSDLFFQRLEEEGEHAQEHERRTLWRLAVKLDKASGGHSYAGLGKLDQIPLWVRKLLHETYAPDQVAPTKKPAAPKPAPKGTKSGGVTAARSGASSRTPKAAAQTAVTRAPGGPSSRAPLNRRAPEQEPLE